MEVTSKTRFHKTNVDHLSGGRTTTMVRTRAHDGLAIFIASATTSEKKPFISPGTFHLINFKARGLFIAKSPNEH